MDAQTKKIFKSIQKFMEQQVEINEGQSLINKRFNKDLTKIEKQMKK